MEGGDAPAPAPVQVIVHDTQHAAPVTDTKHARTHASSTSTSVPNSVLGLKLSDSHGVHKLATHSNVDLQHYFTGPRDLNKHSKMPYFFRMHGSVFPKMIAPLLLVAVWATLITCLSKFVYDLGISSLLLTVLGFVVGLALSFRSTTAYERYAEGRRYWSTLSMTSRNLARLIWIHTSEPTGPEALDAVLGKLSGINLVLTFAIALKHKLRFEPFISYPDIVGLVSHLDTVARTASTPDNIPISKPPNFFKSTGMYLGLSLAESNPRKVMKRSKLPTGNLPMEVLTYLSAYIESLIERGMISAIMQGQVFTAIASMTDVLSGTERVLSTPMPEAYSIATSQITWLYILALPFQLFPSLGWIAIPGTLAGAYIILGIAAIGHEIENPFGHDVNDLPLDAYCRELASDLDMITALSPPQSGGMFWKSEENKILWPMSSIGYGEWERRGLGELREALKSKVGVGARL